MTQQSRLEGELPANIMARQQVYHNVNIALRYYRYLRAFCENAVDSMDWYVGEEKIPIYIRSIAETRLETMTILTHMDMAVKTYLELCKQDGNARPAEVIIKKYIDPQGGSNGKGKPYTNQELAEMFSVDRRTIDRDIRQGKERLAILLFGFTGIKAIDKEKTTR